MAHLAVIDITDPDPGACAERLEAGEIIVAHARTSLPAAELALLRNHDWVSSAHKNIAYDPRTNRVTGVGARRPVTTALHRILRTHADQITAEVARLLPAYAAAWTVDVTSFRPLEEAERNLPGRARNDLLHIDAFPSRPTSGNRILRVFTNLHTVKPRVWLTADPLHQQLPWLRQLPNFPHPHATRRGAWVRAHLARLLRVPALDRSPYDRFMLRLHDFMKESVAFQRACRRDRHSFAPETTWMVFTDIVPHAVVSGQCALEQTFIVPHASTQSREAAPLTLFGALTLPADDASQGTARSTASSRSS